MEWLKWVKTYNSIAKRTAKFNTWEQREPDYSLTSWGISLRNGMWWQFVKTDSGYIGKWFALNDNIYSADIPKEIFIDFYNFIIHGKKLPSTKEDIGKEVLGTIDQPVSIYKNFIGSKTIN
jgi:hypothetical protein